MSVKRLNRNIWKKTMPKEMVLIALMINSQQLNMSNTSIRTIARNLYHMTKNPAINAL